MRYAMTSARPPAAELVPLAARVRHMQLFRSAAGAATLVLAAATVDAAPASLMPLMAGTVAYLLLSLASEWLWRRTMGRGLALFGGMLLIDGLYLGWAASGTGGSASPVRHVILLHLIAVALLASYRTSLKLALWHSLLALVAFHAQQTGVVGPAAAAADTHGELRGLAVFITVFWLVAVITAAFSAVNERELRRRRFDLEALARFAAELEATPTPAAIGDALLAHLSDAFGFQRAVLLASPSAAPQLLAHRGCARAMLGDISAHPGSIVERVKRRRSTLLAAAPERSADPWLDALMPGARNLLVVPLTAEDALTGVLICEQHLQAGSRIEQRVVAMVERFADHTALALRSRWLLQEIRAAATTDGLTGIRNRRAFDDALAQEIARAQRTAEPVSLLMIDIDHFKRLNDDHGHQAGDDVLRQVGAALAEHCRPFDIPARYGGEEFAVILPRCGAQQAARIGERLRRAVAQAVTGPPITASAGLATCPQHASSPDVLVATADAVLYEAKRAGRDRLCTAADHPHTVPAMTAGRVPA